MFWQFGIIGVPLHRNTLRQRVMPLLFFEKMRSRDGGMVDTRDLKSLGQEWLCGFESRSRHYLELVVCSKT